MSSTPRRPLFAAITLALAAACAVVAAEVALRLAERIPHRVPLDYPDTWRKGGLGPGGYLAEGFDAQVTDGIGGLVRWTNNAQGFRYDREVSAIPEPGVLRVISMGDSFTAGYRVGQEETFSRLLERKLGERVGPCEVLVSCVEEPATGLYWLEQFGQSYRPHLVLLGLTLGNDIAQTYVAVDPHGAYRFDADAAVVPRDEEATLGFRHGLEGALVPEEDRERKGFVARAAVKLEHLRVVDLVHDPAWPIGSWYGDPARPNLLDPTHGLGFYLMAPPPIVEEAYARLERVLLAYQRFCAERGIRLAVALFPQRFQVQPRDWEQTVVKFGLRAGSFDVETPNRRIGAFCAAHGLSCLDPTPALRRRFAREGRDLYLPRGDMHWNSRGHAAVYEALLGPLSELLAEGTSPQGQAATQASSVSKLLAFPPQPPQMKGSHFPLSTLWYQRGKMPSQGPTTGGRAQGSRQAAAQASSLSKLLAFPPQQPQTNGSHFPVSTT